MRHLIRHLIRHPIRHLIHPAVPFLFVAVLLASAVTCSGASKPATPLGQTGQAITTCAQAETAAVAKGISVLGIERDVNAAIALYQGGGFAAVEAAIEKAIVGDGEQIVECAVLSGAAPIIATQAAPGDAGASAATPTPMIAAAAGSPAAIRR